jgi:solute carrier family 12 sodium/potassium/chloride transporter 2
MNVSVAILRLKDGLDYSGIIADIDDLILNKAPTKKTNENPTVPGIKCSTLCSSTNQLTIVLLYF